MTVRAAVARRRAGGVRLSRIQKGRDYHAAATRQEARFRQEVPEAQARPEQLAARSSAVVWRRDGGAQHCGFSYCSLRRATAAPRGARFRQEVPVSNTSPDG